MRDYGNRNYLNRADSLKVRRKKQEARGRIWPWILIALFLLGFGQLKNLGAERAKRADKEMVKENEKEILDEGKVGLVKIEEASGNQRLDPVNLSENKVILAIRTKLEQVRGEYSLWVESFWDGEIYGINYREERTAASINKVPIMVTFLSKEEKGEIGLSDIYVWNSQDYEGGTGIIQYDKERSQYTLGELINFMGKYSDNMATNVVIRKVGKETVQDFCDNQGLAKTSIEKNTTSAEDMGKLFSRIYNRQIFESEASRQLLLDALTRTDFEDRIARDLPDNVRVAHKIGTQIQAIGDCGLVMGEKSYSICILSDRVSEEEALEILPYISKKVWEYESSK